MDRFHTDWIIVRAALAEAQRERDMAQQRESKALEMSDAASRALIRACAKCERLTGELAAAQAEAAKLREVLTRAQWQVNGTCVVCRQPIHTDDCAVGCALAAPPSTAATPTEEA